MSALDSDCSDDDDARSTDSTFKRHKFDLANHLTRCASPLAIHPRPEYPDGSPAVGRRIKMLRGGDAASPLSAVATSPPLPLFLSNLVGSVDLNRTSTDAVIAQQLARCGTLQGSAPLSPATSTHVGTRACCVK